MPIDPVMATEPACAGQQVATTLLIIDDESSARRQVRTALEQAGTFTRILEAGDGIEGLSVFMREYVDVVLCDLEMPKLGGDKLLRMRQAHPERQHVPFIFLSASGSVDRRAQLLVDGASDFIAKPFHMAELVARLGLHLRLKRLQDELRVKNLELLELSTVDALTGLRTRRYVDEQLSLEFLRAVRHATPLSVVMADLDHFKAVNDTHGHAAGDAVLRGVGRLSLAMTRRSDVAGRYGGEELVFILVHNGSAGAATWAERMRAAIEAHRFETPGAPLALTASFGVAEYAPQMQAPEDLVAAADRALYAAKHQGRNRVVVAAGENARQ